MKNQIKKLLSLALVVAMCLSTLALCVSAETCAHANKIQTSTTEATCLGYGYTSYKCADCGADFVENLVNPLGHDWSEETTTAATCENKAGTKKECKRCGEDDEKAGASTGKTCKMGEPTFKTEDGKLVKVETCTVCGNVKETVVDSNHSHDVENSNMIMQVETLKKPTCDAKGSVDYKCNNTDCGFVVTVEIQENHQLKNHAAKPHTCEEDGNFEYWTCDLCNEYFMMVKAEGATTATMTKVDAAAIVDKAAHDLKKGDAPKTVGDCTPGIETKDVYTWTCQADECEYTEDREEAELTHKFVYDEAKSFAPTCVKYGLYVEYCEVCGKNKSETKNPLGFLVKVEGTTKTYKTLAQLTSDKATIDAFATKVDAPCGGKASYVYAILEKCTDANCECNDNVLTIYYGDVKEHPYVKVADAVAPTCTQPGQKALYECPVCKEAGAAASVYTDPERDGSTIEALGHEWSEVIEYCSVEDKAILKCAVCGELDEEWLTPAELEELEFVKPEGESHVTLYKEYVAPSCTEDGYKVTYCFACHWTDEEEPIKATGHNIDLQGEYFVQAGSCQQQTLHIYSCQNEGCSYNEAYPQGKDTTVAGHIAAMGTLPTGTVLRPATCTTRSLTQYTCTECGVTFTILGDEDDYGTHVVVERTEDPICAIAQNGKVGLYCTNRGCEKWVEYEEIPFAHDTNGTVAKRDVCLSETEFTANPYGWDAFTYCEACEAYETDETIEKDEDFEMALESKQAMTLKNRKAAHKSDIKHSDRIESTCDAVGVEGFDYCVGCGDDPAKIIAEAKKSATYKWNGVELQIDKKDHMKLADAAVVATCTTFGYKLTYCEFCSGALIVDFDYENGHNLDIPEDEEDILTENLDDTADDYDCTKPGFKYYLCLDCGYKAEIEGTKVAPHHVDADGNKVFDCRDAEEDFTCIHGCEVKLEDLHEYQSLVDDIKLPTCTEPGWKISICRLCGNQEDLTPGEEGNILVLPPVGHHSIWFDEEEETWFYYVYENIAGEDEEPVMAWVAYAAYSLEDAVDMSGVELVDDKCVDATHIADGKLVILCAVCEEEVEFVVEQLKGVDLDITADNAIFAGAPIVNGGKVQFTVVINANDVDAAGLKADFFYDASVLEFIAAESSVAPIFNNDIVVTSSKIGNPKVTTVMGEEIGQITVTAFASKTAGGTSVDVNLNGTDLAFVTLTFRVAADAEDYSQLFGVVSEMTNAKGEMLVDIDVNAVIAYAEFTGKYEELCDKYETELEAYHDAMADVMFAQAVLDELYESYIASEEALKLADDALEAAQADLAAAQAALEAAQAALEVEPENTAAQELVAAKTAEVAAAQTVLAEAQTALTAAQATYDALEAEIEEAEDELEALRDLVAKANKALKDFYAAEDALYEEYEDVMDDFDYEDLLAFGVAAENAYVEFEIAKLGDVNNDGDINLADVVAILMMQFTNMDGTIAEGEYALPTGKTTEDGEDILAEVNYLATADFDMDGDVDLIDYALINQYIVNDITYEQLVLTSQAAAE